MKTIHTVVLVSLLLLILSACGGGGGGSSPNVSPQKKVTLACSTVSTAHSVALEGIQLRLQFPAGVAVTDSSCSLTWRYNGGLQDKSFDSVNRVVTIAYTDITTPIKFGPFADLACDITSGVTLLESDFATATIIKDKQLQGYSSGSAVDLSQIVVGSTAVISNK